MLTDRLRPQPKHRCWLEAPLRGSRIPFLAWARDWARLPERFHTEIKHACTVLAGPKP